MNERATVLFVDDEPQILSAIRRTLADTNLTVLTASGAREALEVLGSRPIDVLVSDVDMPGMSGLELVRIARRDFPGTLRIMLTGGATLDRALEAINSGEVHRFFAKPFDVLLFRETVAALAERIERNRSNQVAQARAARRRQLEQWVDERFPAAVTRLPPVGAQPLRIDLRALVHELSPAAPALTDLLRR